MIRAIDDWLVDRVFQRFADWIADRYQKTVFMTARISVYLVLIVLIPRNVLQYNGANIFEFGLDSLWPLVILVLIRAEEEKLERSGYGMMNELRDYLRIIRYFNIVTIPITATINVTRLIDGSRPFLLTLIFLIGSLLMTAALFFASCSPKPPKPKKEEQEIPVDAVFES